MAARLERNKNLFKMLPVATTNDRTRLFKTLDKDFIFCCRDCCYNILNGKVTNTPEEKQKLQRFKTNVR